MKFLVSASFESITFNKCLRMIFDISPIIQFRSQFIVGIGIERTRYIRYDCRMKVDCRIKFGFYPTFLLSVCNSLSAIILLFVTYMI